MIKRAKSFHEKFYIPNQIRPVCADPLPTVKRLLEDTDAERSDQPDGLDGGAPACAFEGSEPLLLGLGLAIRHMISSQVCLICRQLWISACFLFCAAFVLCTLDGNTGIVRESRTKGFGFGLVS